MPDDNSRRGMVDNVKAWFADAAIRDAVEAARIVAWVSLILAPTAMIIGHFGASDLVWDRNYISTFAARAPNGDWVTAAFLFSAFAMLGIGVVAGSSDGPYGKVIGNFIAMSMGAAAAGLLLLAAFKETASNLTTLRTLGFIEIRQQSFHDAGLVIFVYGIVLALAIAGLAMLTERGGRARIMGAVVALSGPLSYLTFIATWPVEAGIVGIGLKQRVGFLLLWIGSMALLTLLSRLRSAEQSG